MDNSHFFIAGINYKKTDASVRGSLAIGTEQYEQLLQKAGNYGLKELFVLSTCNRTEIYGIAHSATALMQLLCSETSGDLQTFKQLAYVKQGTEAVEHLYNVAAGLDSQILGDYEIVGQIKQAVKFARTHGFVGTFLERLVNSVLQASKAIKTSTSLSGGTVSVSFAAIQYLRKNLPDVQHKKIVLLGTGKIGGNTCRNIIDYLSNTNITLINRSSDKAIALAEELNIRYAPQEAMQQEIDDADVVIVSTNAPQPLIKKEHVQNGGSKILIDLSIPNNVDIAVKELPQIQLVNVDELSRLNDETLQKRQAEVPKAKAIIAEHLQEFREWHTNRRHVPVLVAVKQKLMGLHDCSLYNSSPLASEHVTLQPVNNDAIQKVINNMAVKMRCANQPGCNYIEAINDYIGGTTTN